PRFSRVCPRLWRRFRKIPARNEGKISNNRENSRNFSFLRTNCTILFSIEKPPQPPARKKDRVTEILPAPLHSSPIRNERSFPAHQPLMKPTDLSLGQGDEGPCHSNDPEPRPAANFD